MTPNGLHGLKYVTRSLWMGLIIFILVKCLAFPDKKTVYTNYARSAFDWPATGPFDTLQSYQYLPYFSDLIRPLAELPNRYGSAIWGVLIFALYGLGLRVMVRDYPPAEPPREQLGRHLVFIGGILVGSNSIINNQANLLIIGCWLLGVGAVQRERWWLAAMLFALPMFKLYTLVLGLVFAALYPRPLIVRLLLMVVLVNAVPVMLHGVEPVLHRLVTMTDYMTSGTHYRMFDYQSLHEIWMTYIGPIASGQVLPIQAAMGLLVPLLLLGFKWAGGSRTEVNYAALFLTTLWCVSFGPSIEMETYFLIGPVVGWWLAHFATRRPPRWLGLLGLFVVIGFLGSPLNGLLAGVRGTISQARLPFLVAAMLYILHLMEVARRTVVLWRQRVAVSPSAAAPLAP